LALRGSVNISLPTALERTFLRLWVVEAIDSYELKTYDLCC